MTSNKPVAIGIRTFLLSSQRITSVGFPILVGVTVVRFLGSRDFGVYSYTLSLVTGGQILLEFGLDKFLPREFAELGADRNVFARWLGFKLATAAIVYASLLLVSATLLPTQEFTEVISIGGILLFTHAYVSTCRSLLIALGRTGAIALASLAGALFGGTLIAIAFAAGSPPLAAIVGCVVIAGVLELSLLVRTVGGWRWVRPAYPHLITDAARVWEFGAHSLLAVVYMRVGLVVLAVVGGAVSVGTYAMGANVYAAIVFIPAAAALASYPDLTRATTNADRSSFTHLLKRHAFAAITLSIPVFLGFLAFSDEILRVLYGFAEPTSSTILKVSSAAFAVFSLNAILAAALIALHGQRALAKLSLLTSVISVVINVLFICWSREVGAAFATLAADGFTALVLWRVVVHAMNSFWPDNDADAAP